MCKFSCLKKKNGSKQDVQLSLYSSVTARQHLLRGRIGHENIAWIALPAICYEGELPMTSQNFIAEIITAQSKMDHPGVLKCSVRTSGSALVSSSQ